MNISAENCRLCGVSVTDSTRIFLSSTTTFSKTTLLDILDNISTAENIKADLHGEYSICTQCYDKINQLERSKSEVVQITAGLVEQLKQKTPPKTYHRFKKIYNCDNCDYTTRVSGLLGYHLRNCSLAATPSVAEVESNDLDGLQVKDVPGGVLTINQQQYG